MTREKQYFGTDGIRGTVGQYPITPDFVLKLGWAAGRVFAKTGSGKVLIGKDTRISGYMFESALEAGLTSAGVDIDLLGPMPTPAVAYLTRTFHAQAGIVISASHNPFEDNGIKFFSGTGAKLDDEIEYAIEQLMDEPLATVNSSELGKASRIGDASGRYIEFCKSTVNHGGVTLNGLKIVLDCANGATYQVAPSVFRELGATVTTIASSPDGFNINEGCGSTNPAGLMSAVREQKADLGIAFDGDGDRVIMVDHTGAEVDGDELLYIIARDKLKQRRGEGVVGTVMSNLGLEQALEREGIPFHRAKVGDRHVLADLVERGWKCGGESSGHIICLDHTTTGDGIISALQVLASMQKEGKSLNEMKRGMEKMPQVMVNVRLKEKKPVNGNTAIQTAVSDIENTLGQRGRVLLRPSGTEPVIRVMVEGIDDGQVSQLAQQLSEVVAKEMA